jgi:hypothetical protein
MDGGLDDGRTAPIDKGNFLSNGYRGAASPGLMRRGHKVDNSPASAREVRSVWGDTTVPTYVFMYLPGAGIIQAQVQPYIYILNLLKPTGHVMLQQAEHSTTVRSAHTVFMCFVFI